MNNELNPQEKKTILDILNEVAPNEGVPKDRKIVPYSEFSRRLEDRKAIENMRKFID